MRHTLFVLALGAVVAVAGSAAARQAASKPTVLASWRGSVAGVTQDDRGAIAWCEKRDDGSRMFVLSGRGGTTRSSSVWDCPPTDWPDGRWSYVLTGGTVTYGGYEELRCADTHWAVYQLVRSHQRKVTLVHHTCSGFGRNFRGVVSDGTSVFYGTVSYAGYDLNCDLDNVCTFRLSGGGVYRVSAGRSTRVQGYGPAAEIAASKGQIATVEAMTGGTEDTVNGPAIGVAGAAENGLVEVRRARDAALISSFRPPGVVHALALSPRYVVALVQSDGATRIDWYDSSSGRKLGSHPLPTNTTPHISASDRAVVFVLGKTIHALDLPGGRDHQLWRAAHPPVSLTISGARLVWGENSARYWNSDGSQSASVLTLTLP